LRAQECREVLDGYGGKFHLVGGPVAAFFPQNEIVLILVAAFVAVDVEIAAKKDVVTKQDSATSPASMH
jgi:hypothetical protein